MLKNLLNWDVVVFADDAIDSLFIEQKDHSEHSLNYISLDLGKTIGSANTMKE